MPEIVNARMAAASFLDGLTDGDIVSVYSFNTDVTELAPPTPVSSATRAVLLQRVQCLYASGGTNLHDGLLAGRLATDRAPATHPVRRIVMISDGRATVGDTDFKAYLGGIQEMNLKLKETFDAEGIEFAFPTQTVHIKNDAPLAVTAG